MPEVSRGHPAQAQHLRFLGCTDFAGGVGGCCKAFTRRRAEPEQGKHLSKAGDGPYDRTWPKHRGRAPHLTAASHAGSPLHHPRTPRHGTQRSFPLQTVFRERTSHTAHHPCPCLPVFFLGELTLPSSLAIPTTTLQRGPQQVEQLGEERGEEPPQRCASPALLGPLPRKQEEGEEMTFIPNDAFQDTSCQKHTSDS